MYAPTAKNRQKQQGLPVTDRAGRTIGRLIGRQYHKLVSRPDQVLLSKGGIGFVDFDAACQAEPARDLGLFRATLKDIGLTRKAEDHMPEPPREAQLATYERLDRLGDAFLSGYLEVAPPVSPVRLLLWETAEVLDYVLSCWRKVKPEKLAANMLMLERQVSGPLETGTAAR